VALRQHLAQRALVRTQRELAHRSLHDALTGLPNRALVLDRAEQTLARARRRQAATTAMYVDLDGLKHLNDTFGHAAGDELLCVVARRMLASFASYLESALVQMRERSATLGREVDLVRAYLEVQQVRMGARLKVKIDVPDALRAHAYPPMMLISLVENAIKHGLDPLRSGGTIAIEARVANVAVAGSHNSSGHVTSFVIVASSWSTIAAAVRGPSGVIHSFVMPRRASSVPPCCATAALPA